MANQQTLQQQLESLEQDFNSYEKLARKIPLENKIVQSRIIKVRQVASKLRTCLRGCKSLQTPPPTSNIQQNPQEVAEAQAMITAFDQAKTPEDVFLKISKSEFVSALKQRVADPKGVDQSQLNLCGAASFMVLWIERDPRGFTKAAIEVFQTGKSMYKDIEIKANKAMFEREEFSPQKYRLQLVDWMMLSSLQNASGLLGYNPDNELGGIRGIGLPGKVLEWFEKLSGGDAKKYKKDFKPSALNKLYRQDHYILFLINVNLMDNYFTDASYKNPDDGFFAKMATFFAGLTGNHYVVLNSPIRKEGDELVFDLWTWAKNLEVRIPGRPFKKAVVQTFVVEPEKEGDDEY